MKDLIDAALRHFDIYDITCPLCMYTFNRPHVICNNGHTVCLDCLDHYRIRVPQIRSECPCCKDKMIEQPITNRSAEYFIRWFHETLKEIIPYVRGDAVDFHLAGFLEMNPTVSVETLPPFVCSKNASWCPAKIHDVDITNCEYIIVPDIPSDLITIFGTAAFRVRIPFTDANNLLAPQYAHTTPWRTMQWIRQNAAQTFFLRDSTNTWIPAILLWDRIHASNREEILIGYETNIGRRTKWIHLNDESIQVDSSIAHMGRQDANMTTL